MNISRNQIRSVYSGQKNPYRTYLHFSQQNTEQKKDCRQVDSVEISQKNHTLKGSEEKITATSGKDSLGITKGDKENSYIVHFSDSAKVSRAVSRGYITVNGTEIELTEEMKQQLLKVDKEASAAREKAYNDYVMQHEMAVAKQQSEAWSRAFDGMSDSLSILLKMNHTEKGVSWSQFEWKTYDTQMTVAFEDGVKVEDISKGMSKISGSVQSCSKENKNAH